MTPYEYLLVMAACLVITLPLELILGAHVWRAPRHLMRALLPVLLVFGAWDLLGIHRGWWTYSEKFTTGLMLGPVPLEEIVFFVVVPTCALLTYEAVGNVLTWVQGRSRDRAPHA